MTICVNPKAVLALRYTRRVKLVVSLSRHEPRVLTFSTAHPTLSCNCFSGHTFGIYKPSIPVTKSRVS